MRLHYIFVGKPKDVNYQGRTITTGIYKEKIMGPVKVNQLNIEGDQQADLTVHGGVDKAVYAYPMEHYTYWREQRPDLEFEPGRFGENLAVEGLEEKTVCIGDTFKMGSAVLSVTSPRMPCNKLAMKMGDPTFIKDFMLANRSGFYLKVLEEGIIRAMDPIEKISDDGYGLSIHEVVSLYTVEKENKELGQKAVDSPSLPEDWKDYFRKRL